MLEDPRTCPPDKAADVTDAAAKSDGFRRLGGLRRAQPADMTLKNLLSVLDLKLELCSQLPVCEWEAGNEGHADYATVFKRLAEAERRSCGEVLDCLRAYLEENSGGAPRRRR